MVVAVLLFNMRLGCRDRNTQAVHLAVVVGGCWWWFAVVDGGGWRLLTVVDVVGGWYK